MPNFTTRIGSSFLVRPWDDPPTSDKASRLFPGTTAPHLRFVVPSAVVVEILATPTGMSEAPLDSALSGKTFLAWLSEFPGAAGFCPVVFSPVPGRTSLQNFRPRRPGHYTFHMRQRGGGSVIMHFDVEPN